MATLFKLILVSLTGMNFSVQVERGFSRLPGDMKVGQLGKRGSQKLLLGPNQFV